jgi:hypothetical protein
MDQARWIIVFSVVVCMIATLTILGRIYQPEIIYIDGETGEMVQKHTSKTEDQSFSYEPKAWKTRKNKNIKYSKPPKQVFAVESPRAFQEEGRRFLEDGKIVEK